MISSAVAAHRASSKCAQIVDGGDTSVRVAFSQRCPTMAHHEHDDRDTELQAVTIGPLEILDGPVTLHEYDQRWPQQFAEQSTRIRAALSERVLRLEHVGSSAVAGLVAKPRIDVP